MNKLKLLILIICLLCLSNMKAIAYGTNNPYSQYGIGEVHNSAFTSHKAMGGVSLTESSEARYSLQNPATLGKLQYTLLNSGVFLGSQSFDSDNDAIPSSESGLSYFALAFPLHRERGIGFGLGLTSQTRQSYETIQRGEDGIRQTNFGDGGISRAYAGIGVRIVDNLYLGINGSLIFGNFFTEKVRDYPNLNNTHNYYELNSYSVSDFSFDAGLLYTFKLSNTSALHLGITGKINRPLSVSHDRYVLVRSANQVRDTISIEEDQSSKMEMPLEFAASVRYEISSDWSISTEAGFSSWSDFYLKNHETALKDSYFGAFGVHFNPAGDGVESYWHRVSYMAGMKYAKKNIEGDRGQVDKMSLSLGLELPLRRRHSGVAIAFEAGRTGLTSDRGFVGDFVRINLGFSFAERWFERRMYD